MSEEINHKQLLTILSDFDEVCGKNEISYSLHGGTLLGAVREKGFIPWDDDADVSMTRWEFKRLEAVLDNSHSNYAIRGNIKKQFYRVGEDSFWVDIFLCDPISEKKVPQKLKLLLLTVLDIMNRDRESVKLSNLAEYSKIKQMVFKAVFALGHIIPKSWTVKWYLHISERCFAGKREMLFRSNDQYQGRARIFPTKWMESYEKISFEDQQLSILKDWHGMLSQCYGPDYMVPICQERNAVVHDLVRLADTFAL